MLAEYWILVAICVAYGQSDSVDRNDTRALLNERIERMKWDVFVTEATTINILSQIEKIYAKFAQEDYNTTEEFRGMLAFSDGVINRTKEHYADVETEARASGEVKCMPSNLYVVKLVAEDGDRIVEPVRRAILGSLRFDNATKAECVELWTNAAETYLNLFRQLLRIYEAHPNEYVAIGEANDWGRVTALTPTESTPEIVSVSREIKTLLDETSARIRPFSDRFRELNIFG